MNPLWPCLFHQHGLDPKGENFIQPQPLPKVMKNTNDDKKKDNNSAPPVSVPPPPKNDDGGDKGLDKGNDKIEGMKFSHNSTTETCDGFNKCTDDGGMVACISKIGTHCSSLLLIIR